MYLCFSSFMRKEFFSFLELIFFSNIYVLILRSPCRSFSQTSSIIKKKLKYLKLFLFKKFIAVAKNTEAYIELCQTSLMAHTAWKVSKYGVFSGSYLDTFHVVTFLSEQFTLNNPIDFFCLFVLFCFKQILIDTE